MLIFENISLNVAGKILIENSSVNINDGAKIGFVGKNGSGKSSLFKAILSDIPLQQGQFIYPKYWKINNVKQEIHDLDLTLIEFILKQDTERTELLQKLANTESAEEIAIIHERLQDINAYSSPARAQQILANLGFNQEMQNMPLAKFSGGKRMRVALAAALFTPSDLLLLDEPNNYLDLEGIIWLENYIKNFKSTVILISHDRDLLNNSTDFILSLENKKLALWRGNYDSYLKMRSEKQNLALKQNKKQLQQREALENFIARFRAKASKAKQAQSRVKTLEKLKEIELYHEEQSFPFYFNSSANILASPLIKLENISIGYDDKIILKDINLNIDNDDRIALLGANGEGKSSFAKFLANKLKAYNGKKIQSPQLKVSYFDQHHIDILKSDLNAIQHIEEIFPDYNETKCRNLLGKIGFSQEKAYTKVKNLSGGEKCRLAMALSSAKGSHLLILDEPTNHLDIDSRQELINALNSYPGAVILISHDKYLIEATIDRLWQVKNQNITNFSGDIKEYKKLLLENKKEEKNNHKADSNNSGKKNKAEIRKQNAQFRQKFTEIKKLINQTEQEIGELNLELEKILQQLSNEENYTKSPNIIIELNQNKAQITKLITEKEENWLDYNQQYENALQEENILNDS